MQKMLAKKIITVALLTLPVYGAALLTSCSTAHHQESTGQFIDGSVITTKVKAKLLADKYVNSLPITVRTYKNIVQLSGFVNSYKQAERAVRITQSVEGVMRVENDLIIKKY